MTLQDGTPVNPFYFALDFANSGTPNRPNIVPGQSVTLPRSQRTADHFFNTDAFSAPAPFTFGNAGREHHSRARATTFSISPCSAISASAKATRSASAPRRSTRSITRIGAFPGSYPDFGPFFGKIFTSGRAAPHAVRAAVRFLVAESLAQLPPAFRPARRPCWPRFTSPSRGPTCSAGNSDREWRDALDFCDRSRLTLVLREIARDAMPPAGPRSRGWQCREERSSAPASSKTSTATSTVGSPRPAWNSSR